MIGDPYNLDQSELAQFLRQRAQEDPETTPCLDEPPHALLKDPQLQKVCNHLTQCKQLLDICRRPNGEVIEDAYYIKAEDLVLRSEVIVKIVMDFLRKNPLLLKKPV